MIELNLILYAKPRQIRSLTDALLSLAKAARLESGCVTARVFVAAEDSNCLSYIETWESAEELRRMIRSRHFSQLATLLELAAAPPECRFRVIAETHGLEFAAQVRDVPGEGDRKEPAAPPPPWRRRT